MFDLHIALRQVLAAEGSGLHLKVGSRPMVRAHGRLEPIEGSEPLEPDENPTGDGAWPSARCFA